MLLTGVARTFAGAPVQNAKVNYHITRSFSWFWRFRGGRSAAWDGETMTDAEGKFTVTVRLEADSDVKDLPTWYYTYRVQADVTDGAGETQQANLSLPLGKTSVVLAIEGLSAQMVKEKARELTFSVTNLSGEPVDTEVIYQVFKPNKSNHEPGEKVLQATVASNNKFVPEALYRLPSGSYILKISAKDAQGGNVRNLKASCCSRSATNVRRLPPPIGSIRTERNLREILRLLSMSAAVKRISIFFMMSFPAISGWKADACSSPIPSSVSRLLINRSMETG